MSEKNIKTSAIICTRNRPDDIYICLDSLKLQEQKLTEIIIVDSSDKLLKNNKKFKNYFLEQNFWGTKLIYLTSDRASLPYQRNLGVKKSSGDLIYFFDDDISAQPDYIKKLTNYFQENPQYMGGMGSFVNPDKESLRYYIYYRFFLLHGKYNTGNFTFSGMPTYPYNSHKNQDVEVLNGCAVYKREVFQDNLFDEHLSSRAPYEDSDMSKRVSQKHKLFYYPAAKLVNRTSDIGRDESFTHHKMIIYNYSYIFFKNFYPENKLKILGYFWSLLGFYLHAIIYLDFARLRAYNRGLKEFIAGSAQQ